MPLSFILALSLTANAGTDMPVAAAPVALAPLVTSPSELTVGADGSLNVGEPLPIALRVSDATNDYGDDSGGNDSGQDDDDDSDSDKDGCSTMGSASTGLVGLLLLGVGLIVRRRD
jgi:hypothetical protein